MTFRQPVLQRRWKQKRLVVATNSKTLVHQPILRDSPSSVCRFLVQFSHLSPTPCEVAPSSIFERVFIRHAGGYAIANPRRLKPSGGAYYRPRKFRGSFMVDFVRRRSWYSRTNQDG